MNSAYSLHPCRKVGHTHWLQEELQNGVVITDTHMSCCQFPEENNLPKHKTNRMRYRLPYTNMTSSEYSLCEEKLLSKNFFKEFDLCCSSAQRDRDFALRILFECSRSKSKLHVTESSTIFQHGIGTGNGIQFEAAHSSYVRSLNVVDEEYAAELRNLMYFKLAKLTSCSGQDFDEIVEEISRSFLAPDIGDLKRIIRRDNEIDSLQSALQYLYDNNHCKVEYLLLKCFVQMENSSLVLSEPNPGFALIDAFSQKVSGSGWEVCQFLERLRERYNRDEANSASDEDSFSRDFPLYNEVLKAFNDSDELISLSNYYLFFEDHIEDFAEYPLLPFVFPKKNKNAFVTIIKSKVDELDERLGKRGARWRSNPTVILLPIRDVRALNGLIRRIDSDNKSLRDWVDKLTIKSQQPWIPHGSELFQRMNRTSSVPSIVNQKVDGDTIDKMSKFVVQQLNNVNRNEIEPFDASNTVVEKLIEKIDCCTRSCQDYFLREDIGVRYQVLDQLIKLFDLEDERMRRDAAAELVLFLENEAIADSQMPEWLGADDLTESFVLITVELLQDDLFVESLINAFVNKEETNKDVLNAWFALRSLEQYKKSATWGEEEERLFWGTHSQLMGLYDHLIKAPHPHSNEGEKIEALANVLAELWRYNTVDRDLLTTVFTTLFQIDAEELYLLPVDTFQNLIEASLRDNEACERVLEVFNQNDSGPFAQAKVLRERSWEFVRNNDSKDPRDYGVELKTMASRINDLMNPMQFCMQVCQCFRKNGESSDET